MVSGHAKKCPACKGDLDTDSDVCPRCGTDTFLLQSENEEKGAEAISRSKSLDDILASIMDEPSVRSPGKKKKRKELSLDDLDLDLPSEPPKHPKLELDILEEEVLDKGEQKSVTFECQGCGAEVYESASQCPSCGAFFTEGESFTCPVCGSSVPVDSSQCPACGVHFEDDESSSEGAIRSRAAEPSHSAIRSMVEGGGADEAGPVVRGVMDRYSSQRDENPLLVGDVSNLQTSLQEQVESIKSLVSLANRLHVPVDNTQKAIAAATKKARARDLSSAVKLAWSARLSLEQSLALQTAQRLEILGRDLQSRRARGNAFPVAEALVNDAMKEVVEGQVDASFEKLQLAKQDISSRSSGQSEAHSAIQAAEQFINELAELRVAVDGFREILTQGKEALEMGDWETASQLALSAQHRATESLRKGINDEMKRGRQIVMELKMKGRDVSEPIDILKQASAWAKEEGYAEAMRSLKLFRKQVQSY